MWASGTSGVTLGTSSATLFDATTNNGGVPAGVMWIRARSTNSIDCIIRVTGAAAETTYGRLEAGDSPSFANVTKVEGYASATSGAALDLMVQKEADPRGHW
jgi:hypothetical protein